MRFQDDSCLSSVGRGFLEQGIEKDLSLTLLRSSNNVCIGVRWEGCHSSPLVMSAAGVRWEDCHSSPLVMSAAGVRWESCHSCDIYHECEAKEPKYDTRYLLSGLDMLFLSAKKPSVALDQSISSAHGGFDYPSG